MRDCSEVSVLRRAVRAAHKEAYNLLFLGLAHRILKSEFDLKIVAGLKRSGNHAVLNWILSQAKGPCVFWNHVAPLQYPTERHRREFRLNAMAARPTVIFSYEDRHLLAIFHGALGDFIRKHEQQLQRRDLCLILRDPRNLMASRFQKWPHEHDTPDLADHVMTLWREYAETALASDAWPGFKTHAIHFDSFILQSDYRRRLSDALDLNRGDRGLEKVTDHGYGSSFTGTDTTPGADVVTRWQSYAADPAFKRLFVDERLDVLAAHLGEPK